MDRNDIKKISNENSNKVANVEEKVSDSEKADAGNNANFSKNKKKKNKHK